MKLLSKIFPFIAALALLFSCSDEEERPVVATVDDGNIRLSFGGGRSAFGEWTKASSSRAGEPVTMPGERPATVGVFCYNNAVGESAQGYGEVFRNVTFYDLYDIEGKSEFANLVGMWQSVGGDNEWPYWETKPWRKADYKFFAYAPCDERTYDDNNFIGIQSLALPTYAGFDRIIWYIPSYSKDDYLYTDKIYTLNYPDDKATLKDGAVQMTMKHLMSRLRFCFKLGEKYGDLRTIRVKEVMLIAPIRPIKIDMTFDPDNAFNLKSFEYLAYTGNELGENVTMDNELADELGNRLEYVELSAKYNKSAKDEGYVTMPEYQPLASLYFFPHSALPSSLRIRVKYDVYDNDGCLLRKDDYAENDIPFSVKLADMPPGHYRNVLITVEPEYLYALGDHDVPYDGFIVAGH